MKATLSQIEINNHKDSMSKLPKCSLNSNGISRESGSLAEIQFKQHKEKKKIKKISIID